MRRTVFKFSKTENPSSVVPSQLKPQRHPIDSVDIDLMYSHLDVRRVRGPWLPRLCVNFYKLKAIPFVLNVIRDAAEERSHEIRKRCLRDLGKPLDSLRIRGGKWANWDDDLSKLQMPPPNPILEHLYLQTCYPIAHPRYYPVQFEASVEERFVLEEKMCCNLEETLHFNTADFPKVEAHTLVNDRRLNPSAHHIVDTSMLELLFQLRGYSSKWWTEAPKGTLLPLAPCVTLNAASLVSLNNVLDPLTILMRPQLQNNSLRGKDAAHRLVDDTRLNNHSFPIYILISPHAISQWLKGDKPLRERGLRLEGTDLASHEDVIYQHHSTVALYNIEQLQRPLPPNIVSQVKRHYETEQARLDALASVGDEAAYVPIATRKGTAASSAEEIVSVVFPDAKTGLPPEADQSQSSAESSLASSSSTPPHTNTDTPQTPSKRREMLRKMEQTRQKKEVIINGATGRSFYGCFDVSKFAQFPTKIFFSTEDLLALDLKILPNAKPVTGRLRHATVHIVNISEFSREMTALCTVCDVVYNHGVPVVEQQPFTGGRLMKRGKNKQMHVSS